MASTSDAIDGNRRDQEESGHDQEQDSIPVRRNLVT